MGKRIHIGTVKAPKLAAKGSVVQATASGAGPHAKPKRKRRRDERRKAKQELRGLDF